MAQVDFITGTRCGSISATCGTNGPRPVFSGVTTSVRLRLAEDNGERVARQDRPVLKKSTWPRQCAWGPAKSRSPRSKSNSISSARRFARVEQDRRDAEPVHIQSLQQFAERAYRRPLTVRKSERGWRNSIAPRRVNDG